MKNGCELGGSNEIFGTNLPGIGQFLYPLSFTVFLRDSMFVFFSLPQPHVVLFIGELY